jgi:hypothetical protein
LRFPQTEGIFIDMLDKRNIIQQEEPAILVGVVHKDQTEPQVQEYLDELAFLAETAGAVAVRRLCQKLQHPDSRTFVGRETGGDPELFGWKEYPGNHI